MCCWTAHGMSNKLWMVLLFFLFIIVYLQLTKKSLARCDSIIKLQYRRVSEERTKQRPLETNFRSTWNQNSPFFLLSCDSCAAFLFKFLIFNPFRFIMSIIQSIPEGENQVLSLFSLLISIILEVNWVVNCVSCWLQTLGQFPNVIGWKISAIITVLFCVFFWSFLFSLMVMC